MTYNLFFRKQIMDHQREIVLKIRFLLNQSPYSAKGEHPTLFRILSFYLWSHLKAAFKENLSLKYIPQCISLSKCLGEFPKHGLISCQPLYAKGEKAGVQICLKREDRVTPHIFHVEQWFFSKSSLPRGIEFPGTNLHFSYKETCCTVKSHNLIIHGKLLNNLIGGILLELCLEQTNTKLGSEFLAVKHRRRLQASLGFCVYYSIC